MSLPDVIAIGLGLVLTAVRDPGRRRFRGRDPRPDLRREHRAAQRDRAHDRTSVGGEPRLVDLRDHDPVLRLPDRIRGPRDGSPGAVHACRDGDRRARRRLRAAHGGGRRSGAAAHGRSAGRSARRASPPRCCSAPRQRRWRRSRARLTARPRSLRSLGRACSRSSSGCSRSLSAPTSRRPSSRTGSSARDSRCSRSASAAAACRQQRPCSPSASSLCSPPPGRPRRYGTTSGPPPCR